MQRSQAVLLVGAARAPGIGRATAARLARAGASLVLADAVGTGAGTGTVDLRRLDEVSAEVSAILGHDVPRFCVDPTDPDSVTELVSRAKRELGRLDACCIMIGATGDSVGDGRLLDVNPSAWHLGLAWNLTAPWLFARACAPVLATGGGGSIVFLSSYAGLRPMEGAGVVGIARAAVNHMTAVLACELGAYGIRVNAVCPLGVNPDDPRFPNPGLEKLATSMGMSTKDYLARATPLGRGQSTDETAAVVEFLISDASSFVSGVSLPIAGGAPA